MDQPLDTALSPEAVRLRSQRFASLRAAQRALSRSVHPSELAQANEQGRQLVIQLQALGARAGESVADAAAREQQQAELRRVDALLADVSQRTRAILERVGFSQLRSIVPMLADEHPDEVRGLIDVVIEGGLAEDRDLRTLEYLVTVLCSEQRNGRRILAREPGEVSERLRELGREQLARTDGQAEEAERTFHEALQTISGEGEIGEVRDRIRRYKEQLHAQLIHPRVFSAAVAYNVAMWNRVAGLIEGSRSIDRLADELLDVEGPAPGAAPVAATSDLLGSAGFSRIVEALGERLGGRGSTDQTARSVAGAFRLEGLEPLEVEAFGSDDADTATRLTQAAVALALTVRHADEVANGLRELRLDPDILASHCVDELQAEMRGAARKLFAESRYDDAFRLAEIKTRNLTPLARRPRRRSAPGPAATAGAPHVAPEPGFLLKLLRLDWLPSGQARALAAFGLLILGVGLWWTPGSDVSMLSPDELSRVSPFLDSGFRSESDGEARFLGRLHPTWDYLEPHQRHRVVAEIGAALEQDGITQVALEDRWKRVQGRYENGRVLEPSAPPSP
jgi:hypothetical protein